ncbi:30S ribosomal protein S19e [Candidatus Woesearchaeota archaeon]|nr:30S ribosomal protein S19e [Candidatus Woesearchaeota archaeon]
MVSVYDVDAGELIEKVAAELKSQSLVKPPEWASFAKTGMHKERQPESQDWWYVRSAAILRSVYILGPVGVSKLRTKYGGKRRRGHKTEHFFKGSGSVIRKVLQQLEAAELVKKEDKGIHKGRVIAPKGLSLLDNCASKVYKPAAKQVKEKPIKEEAEPKSKKDEKAEKKAEEKQEKPEKKQSKAEGKPAKPEKAGKDE